jgi:tetratricopeptide (TPR) repeat protein
MVRKSAKELKNIGLGFLNNEMYSHAIEFLTRSIKLDSSDPESLDLRGVAYYRILQMENALADLQQAVAVDPEYYFANAHLGEIAWAKQDYQQVEFYYENALRFNDVSLEYMSYLAYAKWKLKKTEEAITLCNAILDVAPNDKWSLRLLGDVHVDQKRYHEAINCFINLSEQEPESIPYLQYLGYIYAEMGELDQARKYLQIAIHLDPVEAYSYNNLGYVYLKEKDYAEALKLVNQSLSIDASNAFAYRNRALIYIEKKDLAKAKEDLLAALELGFEDLYGNEVNELLAQIP